VMRARLSLACGGAAAIGMALGLVLSPGMGALMAVVRSWHGAVDEPWTNSKPQSDAALVLTFVDGPDAARFEARLERAVHDLEATAAPPIVPSVHWRVFKASSETLGPCLPYVLWIRPASALRDGVLSSLLAQVRPSSGRQRDSADVCSKRPVNLNAVVWRDR